MKARVLIAGAGPAGIATAVAAVRADPRLAGRILVCDRACFPRAKPCGGGLTGHIEEALSGLGLRLTVPSFPSPRAEIRYGTFRREVALGRPVRVVRREEFDASLVDQARALGIEIRERCGLRDFSVVGDSVRAITDGGEITAEVLVGADGAGSLLRKRLGGARSGPPIRLFRAEVSGPPPSDAMVYDFSPMDEGLRGYLWLFPVPGNRINLGVMHYPAPDSPRSGAELVKLLHQRLASDYQIDLPESAARGWPAWGYLPSQRVATHRLLTVGDAAGIDALTGEGIAVALEQGLIAGQTIAQAFATGDLSFSGYRRALRRATVGRELAIDRWLARLLYHQPQRWLPFVLYDEKMLELYAARVSGSLVLADHKWEMVRGIGRHLMGFRARAAAAGVV